MSPINSGSNYQQLISAYFGRSSDPVLPKEKKQFPLIGNMFEKCSVYYDEESKGLILADNDRVFKCCLDNCSSSIDFCHKNCHKMYGDESSKPDNRLYKRCRDQCNVITEDCALLCSQARKMSDNKDPFIQETKRIGCWDDIGDQPSPKCIESNKKHLMDHCMNNCYPTANVNCEERCNTSYNLAVNPEKTSKIFENSLYRTTVQNIKDDDNISSNSLLYILTGVFGGILLAIIAYILSITIFSK